MRKVITVGADDQSMTTVIMHTTMGDIKIQMHEDMPITTGNFVKLSKEGFYDGTIFHRVIDGFMIQGGDPRGDGTGGPGYTIDDEFGTGHSNIRGTISMANTGRPHSGGSQFFINVVNNTYLDKEDPRTPSAHPVFGTVLEGMEVADKISKVRTDRRDRPLEDIKITKMEVIE
jgi:peptidylprolyl isomerase